MTTAHPASKPQWRRTALAAFFLMLGMMPAGQPAYAQVYGNVTVTPSAITTPYDTIPNFGGHPTITAAKSGNWSDATVWSTGKVPGLNDIVSIPANIAVTYDTVMASTAAPTTVSIDGTLAFRPDISTALYVSNLLVMPDGTLQVGTSATPVAANVTAQIIFPDLPLNTATDPAQYGNGLIGLGTVNIHGAPLNETFVRLATAPSAGDSTLTLTQAVTGWKVGDKLLLPDSVQYGNAGTVEGQAYVYKTETPTISAISPDGLTIILKAVLQFNHPGSYAYNNKVDYLPYIADLTRNVTIHSAKATQAARGYALFDDRANVDIRYAAFAGLGRTLNDTIDSTTFDNSGNVTHQGTNQGNRNAVTFLNLMGPNQPQANGTTLLQSGNGPQYTFIGNSVYCPMNPMPYAWGINVNNSHYGLIQDNVVYHWSGAGIAVSAGMVIGNTLTVGVGNNVIHNFVTDTFTYNPNGGATPGETGNIGDDYWINPSLGNFLVNDVGATAGLAVQNDGTMLWENGSAYVYDLGIGFKNGLITVPPQQGQYPSVVVNAYAPQFKTDDDNNPMFSNLEGYGSTNYLTLWSFNVGGAPTPTDPASVQTANSGPKILMNDLTGWNIGQLGMFLYPEIGITMNRLVLENDPSGLGDGNYSPEAIIWNDYLGAMTTINNSKIWGWRLGIQPPTEIIGPLNITNSSLQNVVDVYVSVMWANNGGGGLAPRKVVLDNDTFTVLPPVANPPYQGVVYYTTYPHTSVLMNYSGIGFVKTNYTQLDQVFVYNYNGVQGDNFQVFYPQQGDPGFTLPPSNDGPGGTALVAAEDANGDPLVCLNGYDANGNSLGGVTVLPKGVDTSPYFTQPQQWCDNKQLVTAGAAPFAGEVAP